MESNTNQPARTDHPAIPEAFLKPYDHLSVEPRVYNTWLEGGMGAAGVARSGYFNPDVCVEQGFAPSAEVAPEKRFSIVLPPPNVTGVLHCGHALMLVIEDAMTRRARMQGKRTLWLPGTDHAAIATQSKVEKELSKQGIRRHDLGREGLLEKINEFAQASHDTIVSQVRAMGASIDWSREAFTLDDARNLAVRTAFKQMYDDGLIYRKERIVNWDPKGQTTISDDEIVHEERETTLYTFKYSADFPISIATTRPETKIGDTAVAVHPNGKYKQYIGQTFEVADFCGVPLSIKIIGDDIVEEEFGTGALGVTPAHSLIDADLATRHNLPSIQVIDEYAKIRRPESELLHGLKATDAREKVAQWLRDKGLMENEEKIKHNVSTAERTGGVVEPLPKLQWWVAVNKPFTMRESNIEGIPSGSTTTLKELMIASVRNGQISILPGERFEKVYFNWIENLRDWCISRQIWYGHRIPVWYRGDEITVGEAPVGDGWSQDEDTLDTWFSSGLWTFSTLGWPNAEEFAKNRAFHPTDVLETGYDILFFWVARMILMSGYLLGEVPFKTVYLHGLVRDAKGKKMSKSLGNALDPVELVEKYGADSVRMGLIVGNGPGNDLNLSEDKIKAYRKFSNKLWNVSRFVLESIHGTDEEMAATATRAAAKDDLITGWVAEFEDIAKDVDADYDAYRYYLASEKLYHYIWHTFADKILEASKPMLLTQQRTHVQATLLYLLKRANTMLHPFMPFLTEEIHSYLPVANGTRRVPLVVSSWTD
jgi:valyl-tRNA synthetase